MPKKKIKKASSADPKVVAFACHWAAPEAMNPVKLKKLKHGSRLSAIRIMCSGRVSPAFVIRAFERNADAVLVIACPPGQCHYEFGNEVAAGNMKRVEKLLEVMGIASSRFHFCHASPESNITFEYVVKEFLSCLTHDGVKQLEPVSAEKVS